MSVIAFLNYLEHEKNYSKNTISAYRIDLTEFKDFCITEFDEEELKTVHYNQIRTWIITLVNNQSFK